MKIMGFIWLTAGLNLETITLSLCLQREGCIHWFICGVGETCLLGPPTNTFRFSGSLGSHPAFKDHLSPNSVLPCLLHSGALSALNLVVSLHATKSSSSFRPWVMIPGAYGSQEDDVNNEKCQVKTRDGIDSSELERPYTFWGWEQHLPVSSQFSNHIRIRALQLLDGWRWWCFFHKILDIWIYFYLKSPDVKMLTNIFIL